MHTNNNTATAAPRRPSRLHALPWALLIAGLPGLAVADESREAALEARVAQLEQLVQQLVTQQQAVQQQAVQQAAAGQTTAGQAGRPATATIQSTPIIPSNADTRFSYGGFIKLDAMLTDTSDGEIADASAARTLYVPGAIPVGGTDEGSDLDMHAQFSRFWFSADTTLDSGDVLKGYLEFDLFGGALGNEAATNTYGVTVRHAFASWNHWLVGQTWSNFQDVAALPDAVDFIGPTDGTTFVRQAQIRYSAGPWSFSAENPETLVGGLAGAPARISSDDNLLPDLTLRYLHKADWGHVTLAGLLRELSYENPAGDIDDSRAGFGLSLSGKYVIDANNDLRYMLTAGRGISRYVGLAIGNDAVLDADGQLDDVGMLAGFAAWRHVFHPNLRGNLYYAASHYDHDTALSGTAVTRKVDSLSANLIWTVLPKLDVGVELRLANRELESGAEGDLRRLQMHAKYSF
jgi:hypothetical protein